MLALAEQGILCVLIEMPFRLAVLDIDAADGIQELFPNIDTWYIGGHSLGGAMASSYLSDHTTEFEGLVLLAAYASDSLKESGLHVLSIYGSKDRVLNMEKYRKNKKNLPANHEESIIEGGNHAYFGMYGTQSGDGKATISNVTQILKTANCIAEFILP
jgi:pimeloyl-ACP methyl ester carboxylesterase